MAVKRIWNLKPGGLRSLLAIGVEILMPVAVLPGSGFRLMVIPAQLRVLEVSAQDRMFEVSVDERRS